MYPCNCVNIVDTFLLSQLTHIPSCTSTQQISVFFLPIDYAPIFYFLIFQKNHSLRCQCSLQASYLPLGSRLSKEKRSKHYLEMLFKLSYALFLNAIYEVSHAYICWCTVTTPTKLYYCTTLLLNTVFTYTLDHLRYDTTMPHAPHYCCRYPSCFGSILCVDCGYGVLFLIALL